MRIPTGARQCLAAVAVMLTATAADAQTARTPHAADGHQRPPDTPSEPLWVARSLFGETDVYLLPKGVAAVAFELRPVTFNAGPTAAMSAYRAEFGLPAHFQLGLHATGSTVLGAGVVGDIDAQALEVRWGLAGWGRMWGNPALEVEWQEASRRADVGSLKLLLADQIGDRWRWATNAGWSQETSGARETVRAWTAGVSRETGRFASLGVEVRLAVIDRDEDRGRTPAERELLAGPSIQIRSARRMYITLSPLFAVGASSARSRTTLVAGWTF